MPEYVSKRDGAIERTYRAPAVDQLPLASISLRARNIMPEPPVVTVDIEGGHSVNGKRVHPYDLIGFCDAVLATFTGEELTRARAL